METVGRVAGYVAAVAMGCYLVVKVVWIGAALLGYGASDVRASGWVALNAVTVVMSGTGIALGLALAQPWGKRLPGLPVVFFAWVGAGFLVPMIPYMLLTAFLDAAPSDAASATPRWETMFIVIGFAGMAVGLAVGLPIYMKERWPSRFQGRLGDGPPRVLGRAGTTTVIGGVVLAMLWLSWGLGSTLGFDQDIQYELNARLLQVNSGLWAFLGVWSLWALHRNRPARLPLWIPRTLAFTASGHLFAWSCWKLLLSVIRPGEYSAPEYTLVAVAEHTLGIGLGLAMLALSLGSASRRSR